MLHNMHIWTQIRRLVLTKEKSKRAVCKEFSIHWKTLEKILSHEEPPGYRRLKARERPKLAPFIPIIHTILEQDKTAPKKQRHTNKRIFERLRDEHGYTGGITVVSDIIRQWRLTTAEVFMPLSHKPGEAQFDFGEAEVILCGEPTKVAYCVMSLPFSDAFFVQVFPRECTETFQEGHRRAFEFFGGVPKRISYDNSRIAVAKFVGQRGDDPTREFLRLQSHYLFEHHFCLVRRPMEKGHTENLIGFARRNFMVPVPRVDSLEQLNAELTQRCREDLERRVRGQPANKRTLLSEEQAVLLPLPKSAFEARRIEPAQANSLSLVRFDGNDYSVPTRYAHQKVTAIGGIEEVRLVVRDQLVAKHPRDWSKEQVHYDPVHYLALLERKPGALDFAKPLENWGLPDCFDLLQRRLEADDKTPGVSTNRSHGRREYIKTLRLLETIPLSALTKAIERALAIDVLAVDAIRLLVQQGLEEPTKWFRLDNHPHLQQHSIPPPKLAGYGELVMGASCTMSTGGAV
jgi:transposase